MKMMMIDDDDDEDNEDCDDNDDNELSTTKSWRFKFITMLNIEWFLTY